VIRGELGCPADIEDTHPILAAIKLAEERLAAG
jgi:hypothetical protein